MYDRCRKAASKPVKHRAMQGARGYPWIGVHRKESAPATCKPLKGTAGLVLTSDLDEKRNYLEAWMCDAAIAVEGGAGTKSEVASAFCRQRAVAFVGPSWEPFCETLKRDRSGAVERLIKACLEVFGRSKGANQSLNACTKERVLRDDLKHEFQWRYFDASASAAQVVKWVTDLLPDTSAFPASFPREFTTTSPAATAIGLRDNAG